MKSLVFCILCLMTAALSGAEFKHVGDFLLQAHFKVAGSVLTPIPMKTIVFQVYTDGVTVRINLEEDKDEAHTSFQIYRSDGIGRQRSGSGALEVIPGIQASTNSGGILRHLRLSKESFTITTFPGVSDQTIISYAIAAEPKEKEPESTQKP